MKNFRDMGHEVMRKVSRNRNNVKKTIFKGRHSDSSRYTCIFLVFNVKKEILRAFYC